jgi:hypothetical protein
VPNLCISYYQWVTKEGLTELQTLAKGVAVFCDSVQNQQIRKNPENAFFCVIPAQAGIQLFKEILGLPPSRE